VQPAIAAAVKELTKVERRSFSSQLECVDACTLGEAKAKFFFLKSVRDRQALENRGWVK
jgi:hypothetical protein